MLPTTKKMQFGKPSPNKTLHPGFVEGSVVMGVMVMTVVVEVTGMLVLMVVMAVLMRNDEGDGGGRDNDGDGRMEVMVVTW